ncbi:MAG: hypothetical protein WAZ27_04875 [Minisyncoccia bacterium]
MNILDLPTSELVRVSAEEALIAAAIESILGETPITHFDIIFGAGKSGRLLLTSSIPSAVALTTPHDAEAIATMLKGFRTEARYSIPKPRNRKKGWEILRCSIDGKPAVIAWAAWV